MIVLSTFMLIVIFVILAYMFSEDDNEQAEITKNVDVRNILYRGEKIQVSSRYKWISTDLDGCVCVFEKQPSYHNGEWYLDVNSGFSFSIIKIVTDSKLGVDDSTARNSLQRINDEGEYV